MISSVQIFPKLLGRFNMNTNTTSIPYRLYQHRDDYVLTCEEFIAYQPDVITVIYPSVLPGEKLVRTFEVENRNDILHITAERSRGLGPMWVRSILKVQKNGSELINYETGGVFMAGWSKGVNHAFDEGVLLVLVKHAETTWFMKGSKLTYCISAALTQKLLIFRSISHIEAGSALQSTTADLSTSDPSINRQVNWQASIDVGDTELRVVSSAVHGHRKGYSVKVGDVVYAPFNGASEEREDFFLCSNRW